jgi:hypothetical protein
VVPRGFVTFLVTIARLREGAPQLFAWGIILRSWRADPPFISIRICRRLIVFLAGFAQPQGDMRRLHRLLHHRHQVLTQCCQVHFIAQSGAERFQRAGSIVLAAVEAAINDSLDAMAQRLGEGHDHQRRGDNHQGILLLLAEEAGVPQLFAKGCLDKKPSGNSSPYNRYGT